MEKQLQDEARDVAAPPKTTKRRTLPVRGSPASDVIVVSQESAVVAAMAWKERYEQVLAANQRLKAHLDTIEKAHRKALTTVKYEPALPNNDTFTKQLLDEKRELLAKNRAMELRLFRVDGSAVRADSSPLSSKGARRTEKPSLKKQQAHTSESTSVQTDPVPESSSSSMKPGAIPPSVLALLGDLKARLRELEVDLDRLRQENELLRHEKQAVEPIAPVDSPVDDNSENLKPTNGPGSKASQEQQELQSSLRDQMRQMGLLEARYHHLEEKARAKAALHKQTLHQMQQLNEQCFDAQQQILEQTAAIQALQDQTAHMEQLRSEAHLLRSENLKLNDAITTLSARPFDELSVDLQKKNLWIGQLEATNSALERQLEQARQDFRVAQRSSAQLRERLHKQQQELDVQAHRLAQSQRDCELHKMAQELAELQLRFYTAPGDKVLMCALGKALKEMRMQQDTAAKATSFMEKVDPKTNTRSESAGGVRCDPGAHDQEDGSTTANANSLDRLRLAKVSELTQLLKDDTQAQLSSLKLSHAQEMQLLKREVKKWEKRATTYLEQIRGLQRENSELVQRCCTESRQRSSISNRQTDGMMTATTATETAVSEGIKSTDSLSRPCARADREDPMNIVEIVVSELRFATELSPPASSAGQTTRHRSFVLLCDYYDFESQISPVISFPSEGEEEKDSRSVVLLDFGITYKTCQDAAFFRTIIAHHVRIELHELAIGCATLVAFADCDLHTLFLSPTGQCAMVLKLLNPYHHPQVAIGSLKVTQALEHPVDAFYKSIIRSSSGNLVPWPRSAAHTPSATEQKMKAVTLSPNGFVAIRVVACLLLKTFVSELETASSRTKNTSGDLQLSYRFVGFPRVNIPIVIPMTPSKGGYFLVLRENIRSFGVEASAEFQRFLRHKCVLEMQLRSSSKMEAAGVNGDGNEVTVHGQVSIPWADVMRQVSNHPSCASPSSSGSSIVLFASLHDSSGNNNKDRLIGRMAIEITLRGFPYTTSGIAPAPSPSVFLPVTPVQTTQTIQKLFAFTPHDGNMGVMVNWTKFWDAMHLSPLQQALRHLLHQKKPPTATNAGKLLSKLRAARATSEAQTSVGIFQSLDSFRSLFAGSGILLTSVDLAMFLSGLLHDEGWENSASSSSGRAIHSVLTDATSERHRDSVWRTFELICETCDDEWLVLEESLRRRAHSLGSLKADAPSDNSTMKSSSGDVVVAIPWETFQIIQQHKQTRSSILSSSVIASFTWDLHQRCGRKANIGFYLVQSHDAVEVYKLEIVELPRRERVIVVLHEILQKQQTTTKHPNPVSDRQTVGALYKHAKEDEKAVNSPTDHRPHPPRQ